MSQDLLPCISLGNICKAAAALENQHVVQMHGHSISADLLTFCLQFWKENVEKFEEKDFQILRVLLKLLEASRETRTLAVGCHDLGMFITTHPHGRSIVTGGFNRLAAVCVAYSSVNQAINSFYSLG